MRKYLKNIILLFRYYIPIITILKKNQYVNIKLFRFNKWHHGYAYFIVVKNDQEYFVKVDTKLHLLQNDILVSKIANKKLKKYLLDIESSYLNKNIQIIVYKYYKNAIELNEKHILKNLFIISDMVHIVNNINESNIIHRDIKLDNFFIVDNQIKILDFTFAVSLDKELGFKELEINVKNLAILEFLGDGYNPKPFVWNDCFALCNIFNKIKKKYNIKALYADVINCKEFSTYEIKPTKEYLKLRQIKIKVKSFLGYKNIHRNLSE